MNAEPEYELVITPPARRALTDRLPELVAAAVIDFITTALVQHPHRLGKPLRAELRGIWATRRGSYRVLYRIRENPREIVVLRIEHRRDAYLPADLHRRPALLRADRDARRRLRMPVPTMWQDQPRHPRPTPSAGSFSTHSQPTGERRDGPTGRGVARGSGFVPHRFGIPDRAVAAPVMTIQVTSESHEE